MSLGNVCFADLALRMFWKIVSMTKFVLSIEIVELIRFVSLIAVSDILFIGFGSLLIS